MSKVTAYEHGDIRPDTGTITDRGNYGTDPTHDEFSISKDIGNGVEDARAAFARADTFAQLYGVAVAPKPGVYLIGTSLTLTSPLRIIPGVVLKPSTGATVTINGGLYGDASATALSTGDGGAFAYGASPRVERFGTVYADTFIGAVVGSVAASALTGTLLYSTLPTGGGTWANGGNLTLTGGDLVLSATAKLRMDGSGVGNTYLYESTGDTLDALVGGFNVIRLTSTDLKTQNILVTGAANYSRSRRADVAQATSSSGNTVSPNFQAMGTGGTDSGFVFIRGSATAGNGPYMIFGRAGAGTPDTDITLLGDAFVLGQIVWAGTDGVDMGTHGARIQATTEGAPIAQRMPSKIAFWTAAGLVNNDIAVKMELGPTGALGMVSGQKFYPDGVARTGDTYSWERTANGWEQFVGGVQALRLDEAAGTVTMTIPTGLTGILRADAGVVSVAAGVGAKTLFDHFADANNGTTVETDLYSDTIPAARLVANGEKLSTEYAGIVTGDATSTQRLRVYFGGTLIFDSGAVTFGVVVASWNVCVTIIRVSSSVVRCSVALSTSFASLAAYVQYTEVTGLTLANTQILKITGTAAGATGGSNQITSKESYVQWLPAAA